MQSAFRHLYVNTILGNPPGIGTASLALPRLSLSVSQFPDTSPWPKLAIQAICR